MRFKILLRDVPAIIIPEPPIYEANTACGAVAKFKEEYQEIDYLEWYITAVVQLENDND